MQGDRSNDSAFNLKRCPHCGKTILRRGTTCPYCLQPISEADRGKTRGPRRLGKQGRSKGSGVSSVAGKDAVVYALAFLMGPLLFFIVYSLFHSMLYGAEITRPEKLQWPPDTSVADPDPTRNAAGDSATPRAGHITGESSSGGRLREVKTAKVVGADESDTSAEREKKIEEAYAQVLEDLRRSEDVTTDTILLKSGRQIECEVTGESDTRIEVRHKGVTITLAKDKIESIERRTPEDVEAELQRLAMARATEIVDEDLVREGRKWVPRKETKQFQVELLRSLLSAGKSSTAEFLGGKLSLDPRGAVDGPITILDAKAVGIDVYELCELLSLPIRARGTCDMDVTTDIAGFELAKLNGRASIIGRDLRVSSVDLEMVALPSTRNAVFTANLVARDGEIRIKSLALKGTAYDLSGTGKIRLSDPLENSRIDFSFSIVFKEPPTLKDRRLIELGAGALMDGLAASGMKLPFKLVGTLESAKIEPGPGSPLAALKR